MEEMNKIEDELEELKEEIKEKGEYLSNIQALNEAHM